MHSLRFRFLSTSLLSVMVVLITAGFVFVSIFEKNLERRVDDELTMVLNQLAAELAFSNAGQLISPLNVSDPRFTRIYSGYYWQIDDTQNNRRLRSRSLWDQVLDLPVDTHDVGETHRYLLTGPSDNTVITQERVLVVATPSGARTIQMAVAIDQQTINSAKRRFATDIVPYLALFGLLMLLASAMQLAIGLRPLNKLAKKLKSIDNAELQRLEDTYPREIQPLANEVNKLLDSQEKALGNARKRASDLAHGLKTPLTVLSANAQRQIQHGDVEEGQVLLEQVKQMQNRIDHELARSRIAPSKNNRNSDAKPLEAIALIVNTLTRTPQGEHLSWKLHIDPSLLHWRQGLLDDMEKVTSSPSAVRTARRLKSQLKQATHSFNALLIPTSTAHSATSLNPHRDYSDRTTIPVTPKTNEAVANQHQFPYQHIMECNITDTALTALANTVLIPVDPNDAQELLGNLLENACKWATSTVIVTASEVHHDAQKTLVLMIEDDGPGVDPRDISSMMERGTRLDRQVPGTGIGLALVKDICDVYDIDIHIQNRQMPGLCTTLTIPLA